MKNGSPVIRDVKLSTEVSVSTVSKYVNGTERVSLEVESRLKVTIEKRGINRIPLRGR